VDMPLVSILIPVYNREIFIEECINSALNQTYKNIEIIVVDNASTDKTLDICQKFSIDYERVKVFSNEINVGPVLNWMRCIEEASGEFSKILFSDDLLALDCVEKMMTALNSSECGFVFSAAKIGVFQSDSRLSYDIKSDSRLSKDKFLRLICSGMAPLSPGAFLFRTKDIKKNLLADFPSSTIRNYSKHGAGPDVMISLLTLQSYNYVSYLREPLVFFRVHKNSISVFNLNNEVIDSYDSAISFYLVSNSYFFTWFYYLTESWFRRIRMGAKSISPIRLIKANQGKGSLDELFIFFSLFIFFVVPMKIFNKLIKI